jgi:hypothetical protein
LLHSVREMLGNILLLYGILGCSQSSGFVYV